MRRPRLRALVLAAGRGERLRPLTDRIPKPLLPVAGEPIAGATLRHLAAAGCEAAALNLHHLPDALVAYFGPRYAGLPLVYAREAVLQGTLGALFPLRSFLAAADVVLLVNGDSLCRWPLADLVRRHQKSGADATLLLHERLDPAPFGGGVGIDAHGFARSFRRARAGADEVARRLFAGAHALAPRLLERVPEGPGDIVSGLYEPLLAQGGRIATLSTARPWHDLGTPRRYLDGVLDAIAGPFGRRGHAVGAVIDPGAEVVGSAVETAAVVERGARVEASVLLPGASVGSGAHLRRVILGHGARVPAGAALREVLATRDPAATGELVLTPLG